MSSRHLRDDRFEGHCSTSIDRVPLSRSSNTAAGRRVRHRPVAPQETIILLSMSDEVVERTTRLVWGFDDRVRAAPAGSWSNPAPCEGWTARDVVTHVGNNLFG